MEINPRSSPAAGGRAPAVLVLFAAGPQPSPNPTARRAQKPHRTTLTSCSSSAAPISGCTPAQPAFPGGAIDAADDGPVAAALREAAEEVGVDPDGVDVVGTYIKKIAHTIYCHWDKSKEHSCHCIPPYTKHGFNPIKRKNLYIWNYFHFTKEIIFIGWKLNKYCIIKYPMHSLQHSFLRKIYGIVD